jgi:LytS/YehU family sensor histidine kinase
MQLHYVPRALYQDKETLYQYVQEKFSDQNYYLIPEGGSNVLGILGCKEITKNIPIDFDVICCACGTGATMAGITLSLKEHQKAIELEMQALRAQMNPHFIFNCLSSINRFIFKNDNKTASDYLTRFSRLIRMVLMHSQKKLIPLEDELEMLRLYLDLERLRFKDAFDYSITTTNIVDAGTIFIPPLLLQPFCENAVWHGLMHKESKGHLNVIISEVISEDNKVLHCVIEDDGIGRQKAAEMKSKSAETEKSMGLKITTERLALLNKENNFSTFYKIEDILNGENKVSGTRVQLKIRYKESVEELA